MYVVNELALFQCVLQEKKGKSFGKQFCVSVLCFPWFVLMMLVFFLPLAQALKGIAVATAGTGDKHTAA